MKIDRTRVLLTGDTGFIGRHTRAALDPQATWFLRSGNNSASLVQHELRWDPSDSDRSLALAFEVARPDAVVHLGWRDIRNTSAENLEFNVALGERLTAAAVAAGCPRVIHVGTAWECAGLSGPISESDQGTALPDFAAAKLRLRGTATQLCHGSGTELVWARIFYAYGPGQYPGSFLNTVAKMLSRGSDRPIGIDPTVAHDFIYASDVADGLAALALAPNVSGTFDIGTGKATGLRQLAKYAFDSIGVAWPPDTECPEPSPDALVAPSLRLRQLGWRPKVPVGVGVGETIRYSLRNQTGVAGTQDPR